MSESYAIQKEELVRLLELAYESGWKGYLDAKESEAESIAHKFTKSAEKIGSSDGEPYWNRDPVYTPIVAEACADVEISDPLLFDGPHYSSSDGSVTISGADTNYTYMKG